MTLLDFAILVLLLVNAVTGGAALLLALDARRDRQIDYAEGIDGVTENGATHVATFRFDQRQTEPRVAQVGEVEYYSPPVGVAPIGPPTYRIVRDDGAVLFEDTNGGKALRAWEALTHGAEPLAAGVTFLHDGLVRGRIGASA